MLIVQHIETIWSKKSRGMPEAAKRNAVPRKLELPAGNIESADMFIHEVTAREKENFILREKAEISERTDTYWTLTFIREKERVKILFTYEYHKHGQPKRGACKEPLFGLALGETGSLHINGRFTYYSGQYYAQHFLNIGNVSKFDSKLFLENAPDYHIDKMAHLF